MKVDSSFMSELSRTPEPLSTPLEAAFGVPENLSDSDKYTELYNEMVDRLRREAEGIQMNTLQQLLIERIASVYVTIRDLEDNDTWRSAAHRKDMYAHWLDLTKEFNKLLQTNQDQLREGLLKQVFQVISDVVERVPDEKIKQDLRRWFATGFASIEL